MDMTNTATAMSASLLARDVYCVCFPERDGLEILQGELSAARKKFFAGGKKAVKVGKAEIVKGFDGRLSGKLSRRGLYWKKTAGKLPLEEAFELKNGYAVVRRDFRGTITSRVFFDRNHLWIKSEYYDLGNPRAAQVIFKPRDSFNLVERFDREPNGKRYRSTELHPLPYLSGAAEQSILSARFGEPGLIVSTAEGEFCYCPKAEAQARLAALRDIKDGTIVLMPAWEVKDGSLAGEDGEEETSVTFTSLEEYAKVEPGQDAYSEATAPAAPPVSLDGEEFTPEPEPEPELETEPEAPETEPTSGGTVPEDGEAEPAEAPQEAGNILQPEEVSQPEEAPQATETALAGVEYRRTVVDGKIFDRGRTEQQNGLTAYEGEYLDGKRDGFGSYYDKNGNLCYAGFWKDDKKDGMGVSFRDTDHALHITNWENGQPGSFVSLFDKDGNLRYGGRIENGKKEGAGVSFNQADGTIFVGKWENGQPTGLGSSFDRDGNLLYYGGWKDGKRSGHGTEFDGSGGIVFDGEWKDGKYHNGILYQKLNTDAEQDGGQDGLPPSWDL